MKYVLTDDLTVRLVPRYHTAEHYNFSKWFLEEFNVALELIEFINSRGKLRLQYRAIVETDEEWIALILQF
jgi:hypothetical protein